MKRNKIIALITLAMFLLTVLPSAAFASKGPKVEIHVRVKLEFKDSNNAKWAMKPISELKAKGIIAGYKDGSFQPNKPVTRAEALAMVLKASGLAEEVQQRVDSSVYGSVYLPFKDAKSIPQWVRGFVSVAAEKGYLPEEQSGNFQPNKPATRLWVAKLLVRTLGLSDEVGVQTDVQLPFNDAAAVPADAVPFIAVALENGLLQGYPDGTFKPNKPVTRAEMAALLGIADDEVYLPGVKRHKIEGIVVSVDEESSGVTDSVYGDVYSAPAGNITIKKADGSEASYPVAADVRVYIEDQQANLADVTPGLRVELVVNRDGTVIYIESKAEIYKGRITVIDTVYGLTLKTREGEKTFTVADDVKVTINGSTAALADLQPGMMAAVRIENGEASEIKAVCLKQKLKEKVKEKVKDKVKENVKENIKDNMKDKKGRKG